MRIKLIYAILLVVAAGVLGDSAEQTVNLRGVGPDGLAKYTGRSTFECDLEVGGKKKSLPISAVNDDYCDCLDGTDEPGTSACSGRTSGRQGTSPPRFYCKNEGFESQYIPSSHVNDGICERECCDGSDEWQGRIKCPNTCAQLRIEHDLKTKEHRRIVEEGLKLKQSYLDFAQVKMAELKERKAALHLDIERQDALVRDLEVKKDRAAKMMMSKNNSALYGKKLADMSMKLLELQERLAEFETTMAELNEYTAVKNQQDISPKSADASEEQHLMSPHEPELNVEDMQSALQEISLKWMSLNLTATFIDFNLTSDPVISSVIEQHVENDGTSNETFQEDDEDDFFTIDGVYKRLSQYYSSCVSPYIPTFNNANDTETEELFDGEFKAPSAITRQLDEAKSKLDSLTGDMESLDKQVTANYGPENILMKFEGQCFEYNAAEYVYEVCPYGDAKQKQNGNTIANLGRWQSLADGETNISVWKFTGGAQCWNGPQRSMTVKLQCGNENKILSASEPNKCEYEMEMITPVMCTSS